MRNKNKQSGFTLIELLVVIAIIGMLSTTILAMVSQARIKSRDARRKADLAQIAKALELYYNTNFSFPTTGGLWYAATGTNCYGSGTYTYTGATGYIPNLAPTFLGVLPGDPGPNVTNCSGYNYRSDGSSYKLISNSVSGSGGPETFPTVGQPFYDSVRPTTAIMVCSGSTACTTW